VLLHTPDGSDCQITDFMKQLRDTYASVGIATTTFAEAEIVAPLILYSCLSLTSQAHDVCTCSAHMWFHSIQNGLWE